MRHNNRCGSALLLLTMMIAFVIIPMVGLAIDGGMAYLVQAQLSAACDAAALAGTRSLSVGATLSSQLANADTTIRSYMQANFPAGLYRTTNLTVATDIRQTSYKTRTVSVNATVTMPTLFLRLLNHQTATLSASSQSARPDVNIILVLDRSASVQSPAICGIVQASAQAFANKFTNGRDRLGLVTFTITPSLDFAPSLTFKSDSPSLNTTLSRFRCGGDTGSAHALWTGYSQLRAINEPGALNLIVFFTSGIPNGITATLPVKQQADNGTRYGISNPFSPAAIGPSTCKASTLTGAIAQAAGSYTALGWTTGVFDPAPVSVSTTSNPLLASPGCGYFVSSQPASMRGDVAYIPGTDINGNATTGYKTVGVYPNGPYAGRLRVDMPSVVAAASLNAADNAAKRIRGDRNLLPIIYSVGLEGNVAEPLDQDFLRRISNDPASPAFDSSSPAGLFVYAANSAQLSNAFDTVAARIRRLSR